jgi:hypothetical protein
MIEVLLQHNYKPIEENLWIKGDWSVRFDDEQVEVFNDPDKEPGKYYIGPYTTIDLEEILTEIDDH